MKSYWIWYYGEYEIYHTLKVSLVRQEYGFDYPPFWKLPSLYTSVHFEKEIDSEDGGYLIAHANGLGYVELDGKKMKTGIKIMIPPGKHTVGANIAKIGGIPALYVESDICPSDKSWTCNYNTGKHIPVGFNEYFDSLDKNPEQFPYSYEHKLPISTEIKDKGVLYDFGTELYGYLNINNADPGETMGVFYGESIEEALDTEHSILLQDVCGQSQYRLTQRAFRYVYITCNNPEKLEVSMDHEYLPLEQKGAFKCDNELFNKIYDACVRTFHLNCREGFLDGIKRDHWIWSGDAYQSARINAYLFADTDIVRRTAIGLIGKEPIEMHLNLILDYSLLWIIGLYEYYMTYGDVEFLERIYPITLKLLEFCENRSNKDGFFVEKDNDWTFIDWSDIDKTGAVCAEQILLIATYSSLAAISQALGKDPQEFISKSQNLKKKVNEFYWNDSLGAFIDSYESGKNNVTRHANIFALMYDIATPEQAESIIKNVLKNDSITQITTPYFKGYELDVLAKTGDFESIENVLESYYGGMIRLGADTIWEEYVPELEGAAHYAMYGDKYGKSLCHAWGAGPIYLFGRYYLGVYPTAAGYAAFNVEPNLGGLREISGIVPINGGTVKVSLNKDKLCVLTDKDGGTLIWKGKEYKLVPNEELIVENA